MAELKKKHELELQEWQKKYDELLEQYGTMKGRYQEVVDEVGQTHESRTTSTVIFMDNIFNCPSCNKTFIGEEAYTHKCTFDVIEIPVTDFYERDSKVIAWGINGKVYRLVKGESSNETLQAKKRWDSDQDLPAPFPGLFRR
ncbi:MAG: hypothetical protein ABSG45_08030, partial [Nitrososphaerales archaeon]